MKDLKKNSPVDSFFVKAATESWRLYTRHIADAELHEYHRKSTVS